MNLARTICLVVSVLLFNYSGAYARNPSCSARFITLGRLRSIYQRLGIGGTAVTAQLEEISAAGGKGRLAILEAEIPPDEFRGRPKSRDIEAFIYLEKLPEWHDGSKSELIFLRDRRTYDYLKSLQDAGVPLLFAPRQGDDALAAVHHPEESLPELIHREAGTGRGRPLPVLAFGPFADRWVLEHEKRHYDDHVSGRERRMTREIDRIANKHDSRYNTAELGLSADFADNFRRFLMEGRALRAEAARMAEDARRSPNEKVVANDHTMGKVDNPDLKLREVTLKDRAAAQSKRTEWFFDKWADLIEDDLNRLRLLSPKEYQAALGLIRDNLDENSTTLPLSKALSTHFGKASFSISVSTNGSTYRRVTLAELERTSLDPDSSVMCGFLEYPRPAKELPGLKPYLKPKGRRSGSL